MYKYLVIVSVGILAVSCNMRGSNRDFKAEQGAYELKKKEKEEAKGGVFKKSQEAIRQKVGKIHEVLLLSDTASFSSDDSTFFYDKNPITFVSDNNLDRYTDPENYKKTADEKANAMVMNTISLVTDGEKEDGIEYSDSRLIDRLLTCYKDSFFVDCYKISEQQLQQFLSIRYVFAVDEIIYAKPEMKTAGGANEFQGGAYLAIVHVFDLESEAEKRIPLYTFSFVGQNSESIEINSYTPEEMKLRTDLHRNAYKAFNEVCAKHFTVTRPLQGIFLF